MESLSGENISRYGKCLVQNPDVLLEGLSQNSKVGEKLYLCVKFLIIDIFLNNVRPHIIMNTIGNNEGNVEK